MRTIFRILKDYWTFLFFCGFLGFAVVVLSNSFKDDYVMEIILASISMVCLFLYVGRTLRMYRVIHFGKRVEGILKKKHFARGEWILQYEYDIEGVHYKRINAAIAFSLPIKVGEPVTVYYDPKKPRRGYIAELYSPEHRKVLNDA